MTSSASNTAILLTAPGAPGGAAIAVIRVSGPLVVAFLGRCFSKAAAPNRCVHGELRDGETVIDDPVVVLSGDGSWADISLHGGAWVVESALALAQGEGFEIIAGTMLPLPEAAVSEVDSIFDREVLAYLPLARTEWAIRMLLDQPDAWRRIGEMDAAEVLKDRTLWRMLNPSRVAIVGEPNVGKSTLANRLFGQQVSITADMPGTTRDWVGEFADIDGVAVLLVDTPGQREAEDVIERAAIAASQEQIVRSDLVLNVLDATARPGDIHQGDEVLVVINKIDRPAGWDFQSLNTIEISARTGQGMEKLRLEIHRRLGIISLNESRPRWWTERQRKLIAEAIRDSRSPDPRAL